jgi:hypothetical protein
VASGQNNNFEGGFGIMIKNKKEFKKFLLENVKGTFNFDAYVEDAERQTGSTGTAQYELSRFESKSGRPELFDLEMEENA